MINRQLNVDPVQIILHLESAYNKWRFGYTKTVLTDDMMP